jgi:hypothetical protein
MHLCLSACQPAPGYSSSSCRSPAHACAIHAHVHLMQCPFRWSDHVIMSLVPCHWSLYVHTSQVWEPPNHAAHGAGTHRHVLVMDTGATPSFPAVHHPEAASISSIAGTISICNCSDVCSQVNQSVVRLLGDDATAHTVLRHTTTVPPSMVLKGSHVARKTILNVSLH